MSASPRAPTGDIERWLITDKDAGGVYGVARDVYWFDARSRAAAFYVGGDMGRLIVVWAPQTPEESAAGQYLSGKELAALCGLSHHGTEDVPNSSVPSKRRVQCPEFYTFKNGTTAFCTKDKGHDGKHKGWRKEWE